MIYDYKPARDNEYCIIAIDPGSTQLGVAILHIDIDTGDVMDVYTQTIYLSGKFKSFRHDGVVHRMRYLRLQFGSLFEMCNPTLMVYEKGFMNVRRPGAFGPINSSTTIVMDTAVDINRDIQIMEFSPGEVKNAMGAKGNCNKEAMAEACLRNETINKFLNVERVSEHEIDAVAVGLCGRNYYKDRLYMLW